MAKAAVSKNDLGLKKLFESGQHQQVLEQATLPGKTSTQSMVLIGSLSFLGRLTEAKALLALSADRLTAADLARARFTLGIAYLRVSKFKMAESLLAENLRDTACRSLPDTWQGVGIYYYYVGNFTKAQHFSRKALGISIACNDNYIRSLATDLYGHSLVKSGQRAKGIRYLSEAQSLAPSKEAAARFTPQKLIYEAEAGLRPETIIAELEREIASGTKQNSYTHNNLVLELARQWTLRGQWGHARTLLDEVAQSVYGFENRRQEATLQMRLAEIAYRQGEGRSAQHFLQAARRCLNKIADHAYELEILGLDYKVQRDLFNDAEAAQALAKNLHRLAAKYSNATTQRMLGRLGRSGMPMNNPGEDPLGDLVDALALNPKATSKTLIEIGYLGLWPQALGLKPGQELLYIEEDGHWIAVQKDKVHKGESPLSGQSQKILHWLQQGITTKEILIQNVWGYVYDPLRHDSLVYTAITSLRKSLGPASVWLATHDQGWAFEPANIHFTSHSLQAETKPDITETHWPELPADLNWRQARALHQLKQEPIWRISEYRNIFKVSTMTAWRDLDALVKLGYLRKTGRGRATAYLPKETMP